MKTQTEKPTIFFSHATADQPSILPIKDKLIEGSSNAISIFMASDGASIPFGHNWLSEIEEALTMCKLMFVWVTPNSLRSHWTIFEAGYAYSRGIKVVPVGFLGTKLDAIPAPLSILQGFDIASGASLNNIVKVVNTTLDLTIPNLFDDTFYEANVARNSSENDAGILDYLETIEITYTTIATKFDTLPVSDSFFAFLGAILSSRNIAFVATKYELMSIGFRASRRQGVAIPHYRIVVDPIALNSTMLVWTDLLHKIYSSPPDCNFLDLRFKSDWGLPSDLAVIGSRLLNTEVTFDRLRPDRYNFRNIQFFFCLSGESVAGHQQICLKVAVPRSNSLPIPIYSLLRLLEERRIIKRLAN